MKKFRKERYIRQDHKKGGWVFRVRYNGIEKSFNEQDFLSSSMAFNKAVEFRNSLFTGRFIVAEKTIYEVFEESFNIFEARKKTRDNNYSLYNNHIKDYTTPVKNMNSAYIIEKLNTMTNCSNDQIQRAFSIFRRINKTALLKDYIDKDYTIAIKPPTSHKIPSKLSEYLISDIELGKIISACEGLKNEFKAKQYPLMLKMLYLTGMRPAELFALEKSDIDSVIHIYKEIGSSKEESLTIRNAKTPSSVRTIPLTKELKKIVNQAKSLTDYNLLFCKQDGNLYSMRHLSNDFHKISKSLGISFNLYQLRHKFSTDLIVRGVDMRTIQELMGHTSSSMSLYYARSNSELKTEALNNLAHFGTDNAKTP